MKRNPRFRRISAVIMAVLCAALKVFYQKTWPGALMFIHL